MNAACAKETLRFKNQTKTYVFLRNVGSDIFIMKIVVDYRVNRDTSRMKLDMRVEWCFLALYYITAVRNRT